MKSVKKGSLGQSEKKAKVKPRRAVKKSKAKRPPVTVEPRDGRRNGEAQTISDTREEALALAERIKHRFQALLDPPKKRGNR